LSKLKILLNSLIFVGLEIGWIGKQRHFSWTILCTDFVVTPLYQH